MQNEKKEKTRAVDWDRVFDLRLSIRACALDLRDCNKALDRLKEEKRSLTKLRRENSDKIANFHSEIDRLVFGDRRGE